MGKFQKGHKGGPGRPPVLLPEVQKAIDANRNAFKVLVLQKTEPFLNQWLESIIERGVLDGDVLKLKMLLEMALGKMVDEPPEFPLTEEEKILVLEYRRRKLERIANGGA